MITPDYLFLKKYFSKTRKILITTHRSPDGDALGSSIALFDRLRNQGHEVSIVVPNDFPDFLKFLPFIENIVIFEKNEEKGTDLIKNADTFFFLDFNDYCRIDVMKDMIINHDGFKIMVDHHQSPSIKADQILSNPLICSTAELIYDFLEKLDLGLSTEAATALYTGIVTDSGSFKYDLVSAKTHLIISNLLSYDINHGNIHRDLFDNNTISRMKLLGRCLTTNFQIFPEHNTALFFLNQNDLKDCNFSKGDTEGFVNMPLSLKGIVFSAFFIEYHDGIKISFRSKTNFDVNKFSRNHFNGGGHKNASGGKITDMNLEKTIQYFKGLLPDYKNELKR